MEDKNGNSREISWRETRSSETGSRESDEKTDTDQEICVLCGKPAGIPRDRDISLRDCYVEGAGQLCRDCYFKVYGGPKGIGLQ